MSVSKRVTVAARCFFLSQQGCLLNASHAAHVHRVLDGSREGEEACHRAGDQQGHDYDEPEVA